MTTPEDSSPRRRSLGSIELPRTVLVIDDDDATRTLVARWLGKGQLSVLEASSGEQALEVLSSSSAVIDAIVMDVMLPGLDGFATLARMKADPALATIPVVLLSAHANDDLDVVKGVEGGAIDHIAKPFSGPVLVAKIKAACDRARADRDLRKKLVKAEQNATIDPLTGLGNRRFFETRLREEAAFARRHRQQFSLVLIDIDHFKSVNDTFGHEEGDRVLVHVADAIRGILRADDGGFRYGGEEFVLMLRACGAPDAVAASERLRRALERNPIDLGDPPESRVITFSAGVAAPSMDDNFATDALLSRADDALYKAKREGRDRTEVAS